MTSYRRQTGFTLIEILVAMTILAASFAVIFRLLSSAGVGVRASAEYRTALAIAESRMAALAVADKAVLDSVTGVDGSFRWRQRVSIANNLPLAQASNGYVLRRLDVDVEWSSGSSQRVVSLSTFRYRSASR